MPFFCTKRQNPGTRFLPKPERTGVIMVQHWLPIPHWPISGGCMARISLK